MVEEHDHNRGQEEENEIFGKKFEKSKGRLEDEVAKSRNTKLVHFFSPTV
jgi:hypothetical protein